MIVTQVSHPVYPQPTPAPVPPALEPVASETPDAVAKAGARGITLLSGEAAAVVIAEQTEPTPTAAPLDLSGRDLRNEDLSKLDLRGANLAGVDLSGKDLTGLDLTGAKLANARLNGANLTETKLNNVDATGTSFTGALFARASLDNSDFSGAKFNDAYFGGSKDSPDLTGQQAWDQGRNTIVSSSNFTGADFSGVTAKYALTFKSSNLDNAKFDGAKAPGWNGSAAGSGIGFNNSTARNASFKGISADVSADYSDLSGSDFTNSTSGRLSFGGSKLENVSFANSSSRLGFSYIDLRSTDLSVKNKDLGKSGFNNADISGKDFSGYNFSGASFSASGTRVENIFSPGKSMSLENLVTGTNFSGATFKGATFSDFDMRKALVDAGALDGAEMNVNESDSRYAYLGDIFKNVSGSKEAAKILYAMPLKDADT